MKDSLRMSISLVSETTQSILNIFVIHNNSWRLDSILFHLYKPNVTLTLKESQIESHRKFLKIGT
jgi:hypothetical protein